MKLIIVGVAAAIAVSACASPVQKASLYERLGGIHKIAAMIDACEDAEAKDSLLMQNERVKMALGFNRPFVKFAIVNTIAAGTGGPQKCIYSVVPITKWMNLTKEQSERAWALRWKGAEKVGVSKEAFMELKGWYMKEEAKAKPMAPTMETFKEMDSLYARLGGIMSIAAVVDDFVDRIVMDKTINSNPHTVAAVTSGKISGAGLKYLFTELLAQTAGGPYMYSGRSMKDAHKDLMISQEEWDSAGVLFKQTLDKFKVGEREQKELFSAIAATHGDIVKSGGGH
jgi:hemoglobin